MSQLRYVALNNVHLIAKKMLKEPLKGRKNVLRENQIVFCNLALQVPDYVQQRLK